MKPLKLSHPSLTRKTLLREAETIPGAWNGIRIAGLLLLLAGWKSTGGRGLDWQSQPEGARQCGRRTSSWQTYTDGSCYPAQVGKGIDKISARFWVASHSLGWSRRGRVPAEGLQRSIAPTTGTQLAQAPRVRFETAYLPIHPSD